MVWDTKHYKAVKDLSQSQGWEELCKWVESRMRDAAEDLATRDSTNVAAIGRAQGYLRALRELQQHVNHAIGRVGDDDA